MLILLLVIAVGVIPILENPVSTLMNCHPKFRLVVKLLQDKGISLPTSLYPEAVGGFGKKDGPSYTKRGVPQVI